MKKKLLMLLTILLVLTLVGCNSNKNKQDNISVEPIDNVEVQEETPVEPINDESMLGGFVDVEDGTLTDELKDIFNKALDGFLGATYEPVELVATQVVAGTNYKFLANGTKTTNPITKGSYYVIIYKDLEGNIELKNIETIEEKQETKIDPSIYSYWVVVYDQFGNEISRTIAKYGTIVEDPNGKDVKVLTNTYFHTYVDYTDDSSSSSPSTPSQGRTPGLYLNGNLEISWDDFKATYPDAFAETGKIKPYAMEDGWGGYFYSSYFSSMSYSTPYELVIDSSITTIENNAFQSCEWIGEVVFQNVNTLGFSSFSGCSNLTSIDFGNAMQNIESFAFCNDDSLTSVTIPSSVSSIVYDSFDNCTSLSTIIVNSNNSKYDSRDNCNAIIEKATNTIILTCKDSTIPSTVTSIGDYAFKGSSKTSISIPSSVTYIGDCAFSGASLTSITIPNNVVTISYNAFQWCDSLSSVTFESNSQLQTIKSNAFGRCTGLTSITIPDTVTTIENYAFDQVPHVYYNGTATGSPWGANAIN